MTPQDGLARVRGEGSQRSRRVYGGEEGMAPPETELGARDPLEIMRTVFAEPRPVTDDYFWAGSLPPLRPGGVGGAMGVTWAAGDFGMESVPMFCEVGAADACALLR